MINFISLVLMLFFHIIDDYYLQGILAKLKQKSWWKDNAPDSLYKHDYLIALFEHAFSWAVMIHIPLFVLYWDNLASVPLAIIVSSLAINCIAHAFIDDLKANKYKINLIADQALHIIQVFLTWLVLSAYVGGKV